MYDLIVVGAGPSGLSCAIEAQKAGLSAIILEKGGLVDSIRRFPSNLVWFSTPELLEIGDVPFVISTVRPTRVDSLNYYRKVANHHNLNVHFFDSVRSIVRQNDLFQVETLLERVYRGRNVVLATGYFDNPNRLGVAGESLPKVFHYYNEPFEFAGSNVAVVGGRNSAVEASLDLFRHGVAVTLIHRGEWLSSGVKYWILPDMENRIRAGEIKAMFRSQVLEIKHDSIVIQTPEGMRSVPNDFTFVLIGFHPDTSLLDRAGVIVHSDSLAPEFNEKTFETNVSGLFVAGSLTAGKDTNKVFVENGRGHGRNILAAILSQR
jgi:thioredoxin reductase (NADPH)